MSPSTTRERAIAESREKKGQVKYEPISPFSFNRMLKNIDWNFSDSTFVDFGCGKGAAILLASRYGFKKYIGVEYYPELANDCKTNILKFGSLSDKSLDSEIICSDATLYQVPDNANVFYFFNPFDQTLMNQVIQNIETSLTARKRDILILYFNALHKDVIEKYGYTPVYKEEVDKINIWYQGGNHAYVKLQS
jgi:predicted RNA methylase